MEELQSYVPETTKFAIGYQERRNSTKRWICCEEDIQAMHEAYKDCPKKKYYCGVMVETLMRKMRIAKV